LYLFNVLMDSLTIPHRRSVNPNRTGAKSGGMWLSSGCVGPASQKFTMRHERIVRRYFNLKSDT
jgi:hypothetical protein